MQRQLSTTWLLCLFVLRTDWPHDFDFSLMAITERLECILAESSLHSKYDSTITTTERNMIIKVNIRNTLPCTALTWLCHFPTKQREPLNRTAILLRSLWPTTYKWRHWVIDDWHIFPPFVSFNVEPCIQWLSIEGGISWKSPLLRYNNKWLFDFLYEDLSVFAHYSY